ncbi:MAG: mechanosensitive ion channel [Candidatus Scalindua sp.]|nr:mechanosensitive ion channel [Candidatus Scalindua sp.]
MKHCWVISIIFFLFFCSCSLPAQTLEQAAPQTDTKQETQEPEKPVPIPITKISNRAQETYLLLNKIKKDIEPITEILTIREELPLFLSSMNRVHSSWIYRSLNNLTKWKLQKLKQEWNMQLNKLKKWEETLEERSELLDEDSRQLDEMITLWQLTSDSAINNSAPEVIQERAKTTLDQIRETRTQITEHIKVLLTFQDQISEQGLEITKLIDLIVNAEARSRTQLFVRDGPPIWETISDLDGIPSFDSQIFESCINFIQVNREYFDTSKWRCILHITIFAGFLAVMIFFYQQNRHNRLFDRNDEDIKASAFFISYPITTAFLISLFFGGLIHTDRPEAFGELIILLVLFPILRLVPGIFAHELKRPIYYLTGLCFLNIAGYIVGDYILMQRLLLLLISILIIPPLAWWLRPGSRMYQIKSRLTYTLSIIMSSLILFISLVSLVINIIGISYLAYVLTSGMMNILYVTFAMYVITRVLDGFIVLLIRRRSARSFHIVEKYAGQMERRTISVIHLIVLFFWLRMIFRTFGISQPFWNWIVKVAERRWTLGTAEISVGAIFSFFVILAIVFILARLIRTFLETEIFTRLSLPRGVPGAISLMVRYTIIGIGAFLAISAIGIDLGKFGLLAGAVGVGLGFGLRNIIENFVSGLIIIFERPIEVGDTVEVNNIVGNVENIGIRSSTVKTFDGSDVIVPNANLISNQVTNWTMSDRRRRIKLPVKVAYGNDPHKVLELLCKVAGEHQGVLKSPEPMAVFNGFGDNYLDFTLYYWVSDNIFQTMSEIALGVHDTIKEAGIDTPRPKGDFNLKFINTPYLH